MIHRLLGYNKLEFARSFTRVNINVNLKGFFCIPENLHAKLHSVRLGSRDVKEYQKI